VQVPGKDVPVHVTATAPANPPLDVRSRLNVAVLPASTDTLVPPLATGPNSKSSAVPDSATFTVPPDAFDSITSVPDRAGDVALVPGSNCTVIVHVAPAATCAEQPFFTTEKSVDRLTAADVTASIAGLGAVFVTVSVEAALAVFDSWFPKLSEVGDTLICAATAFPPTATDCGLCGALSNTCSTAVRFPACVGLSETLNMQLAPAARLAGQLFGAAKSALSTPVIEIAEIVSGALPEFVSVTLTGTVAIPIVLVPNATLLVESVAPRVTAVPVRGTLCGLPCALSDTFNVAE
jgi:hypothetical protein